jgi:hypothetical protein
MPIGMELIGRQYAEATLLEIASAYEKSGVQWISPPWLNDDNVQHSMANLSIQELNQLFTKIGWVTYNQVLKNGKREDLSSGIFRKIVTLLLPGN